MNKISKNNLIIGLLLAVVFVMAIGFAVFSQQLQINETSSSTTEWNVYISNAVVGNKSENATATVTKAQGLEASFVTTLHSPGDKVVYNVTVKNDGNITATLDELNLNTTNNNSVILYSYAGIEEGDSLASGESKTFTVTVEYDPTKTGTATEEQKKNSGTLQLNFVQGSVSSGGGSSSGGTNAATMLASKAVTSGDGLYADTYEAGRYVYKGAAPSNYITFDGEEAGWRILAVEADGTIKIIRNSILRSEAFDSAGLRENTSNGSGGTYCAQSSYGCNAWAATANLVGQPSEFTNGSVTGTVLLAAGVNTFLNTTYLNTYLNTIDRIIVVSHDFGVGPVTKDNEDLAVQIASEQSYKWNGKIGLMNVSDYLKANTNSAQCETLKLNNTNRDTCQTTNYLFASLVSDSRYPWTITPFSGSPAYVFYVNKNGSVNGYYAQYDNGVAPVLYLSSDITLSGSGTDIDPYEIEHYGSSNVVYRTTEDELYIGDSIEGIETTTDPRTLLLLGYGYYLKHKIDSNNLITASYLCFVTDTEYCIQSGSEYHQSNLDLLRTMENGEFFCSGDEEYMQCTYAGEYFYQLITDGESYSIYATDGSYICAVADDFSGCWRE